MNTKTYYFIAIIFVIAVFFTTAAFSQTTEFPYQGFTNDPSGAPANGSFDFEFRLFEELNGGIAVAVQARANVTVTDGVFNVVLDFGAFPPANRFLETGVRPAGGTTLATLAPRVKLLSTPYSTQAKNAENAANAENAVNAENAQNAVNAQNALNAQNSANAQNSQNAQTAQNALQLGGTPANQFVLGNDPRLNDPRMPLPGSSFYLQNTIAPQASSNFNVSGNGTAGGTLTGNVVSATTQFNIGNARILASPGSFNFFAGVLAGYSNTTGTGNAFFGVNAGVYNTTGGSNTFVGFEAGRNNNAGANNSYFGKDAGRQNNTGNDNSFFGNDAGQTNTTGGSNSFFGKGAGADNTTAIGNSFFGALAGNSNTTGANNAFFGFEAGRLTNTGSDNSFFGYESGESNTTGISNSFFGKDAGRLNTIGNENSFFGFESGESNTTGFSNSFFGYHAGKDNTTGYLNSYFGHLAGSSTTTGIQNSFVGHKAGVLTTDGSSNTMMGTWAGEWNTTGNDNSFFGVFAGNNNETGDDNTMIGAFTDVGGPNLTNATAIGSYAFVTQSDSLILGSIANVNRATSGTKVGIGVTAPLDRLHVNGIIRVVTLGAAGSTGLCRNASLQISACSSSLRYKTGITPFLSGLDIAGRLQPISFTWKNGGMRDLGFGAEDVAAVEPLLVTYNEKGEVEGVKYDRIAVVLLNAVKEQQTQIARQQVQIDDLKQIVCSLNPAAPVCKANR